MARRTRHRGFGSVRQLPSGNWQATWKLAGKTHTARTDDDRPLTFSSRAKAVRWLESHSEAIRSGAWPPPKDPEVATFQAYATSWLATRELETTTREHYRQLLRDHVFPALGKLTVSEVTPAVVRTWYANVAPDAPVARSHAYQLLRTILGTAVDDELIPANPCRIRGASRAKTRHKTVVATLDQLQVMADAMPERLSLMVLLACWCSLRFGELAELRRSDVDTEAKVIRVRRAAVRKTGSARVVKAPKSEAGVRDVHYPQRIAEAVTDHLERFAQDGRDGLLFPSAEGTQIAPSTLYRHWYRAREAAGRPDFHFHDLRHTGQTYAAATGATLRELMNRAGQSSIGAAQRYWHAGRQEDQALASRLDELGTNVTPMTGRTRKGARKPARTRSG